MARRRALRCRYCGHPGSIQRALPGRWRGRRLPRPRTHAQQHLLSRTGRHGPSALRVGLRAGTPPSASADPRRQRRYPAFADFLQPVHAPAGLGDLPDRYRSRTSGLLARTESARPGRCAQLPPGFVFTERTGGTSPADQGLLRARPTGTRNGGGGKWCRPVPQAGKRARTSFAVQRGRILARLCVIPLSDAHCRRGLPRFLQPPECPSRTQHTP
ncbi:hypothetical protein D9M68_560630 [compost metagenome]